LQLENLPMDQTFKMWTRLFSSSPQQLNGVFDHCVSEGKIDKSFLLFLLLIFVIYKKRLEGLCILRRLAAKFGRSSVCLHCMAGFLEISTLVMSTSALNFEKYGGNVGNIVNG
jgi:hypothetical protein